MIVTFLRGRGLVPSQQEHADILATTDVGVLRRWAEAAASCTSVAELIASR